VEEKPRLRAFRKKGEERIGRKTGKAPVQGEYQRGKLQAYYKNMKKFGKKEVDGAKRGANILHCGGMFSGRGKKVHVDEKWNS